MANTTALKRRITSVKSTKQITKAMELVAASKMRQAQEQALATRDYRNAANSILGRLSTVSEAERHPLFIRRPLDSQLLILVSSDRGLAGAYDSNILKQFASILADNKTKKIKTEVIAIGKKAGQFVSRLDKDHLIHAYPMVADNPLPDDIRPFITESLRKFSEGEVDSLGIIYTQFISNLTQEVKYMELLPTLPEADHSMSELEMAFFEPSIEEIIDDAVLRLLEVQIWQSLLESLASEHSMRMLAMKNASDNAGEIIDDLTLEFNTARQAAITQEIAEIVGGAEAITA